MKKSVVSLLLPFLVGVAGQAVGEELSADAIAEPNLHWANRLGISGTVEIDVSHQNNGVGSAIAVGTVELAMDVRINNWTNAHVVLLHEEGEAQDVMVDEASITIGNSELYPIYVTAGKMVVPFGDFSTQLLSDPLTLELAETKENALQVGFERDGWKGSGYIFNGVSDKIGEENQLDQFGFNIGYALEAKSMSLDMGIGYINSMEDSDGISAKLDPNGVTDHSSGLSAHANLKMGPFSMIAEHVIALEDITIKDGAGVGFYGRPQAWNTEFGYAFGFLEKEANVAVGYQGSREVRSLGLQEERILGGVSVVLETDTTLGFEYYHGKEYATNDGFDVDSATLRLAVAF